MQDTDLGARSEHRKDICFMYINPAFAFERHSYRHVEGHLMHAQSDAY
jgi:hypothetical protein